MLIFFFTLLYNAKLHSKVGWSDNKLDFCHMYCAKVLEDPNSYF